MDSNPLISVIVPVYNVVEYVEEAIESILSQTYANLELILVDDGSTDGTTQCCERVVRKDTRVQLIKAKHKGVGASRNQGLRVARGSFIGFVDGDDWIEPDFYEILLNQLFEYDADLSACGFVKINERRDMHFMSALESTICYSREEAIANLFDFSHMRYSSCNKLFKASLFEGIDYPEDCSIDDKMTTYKLIHKCERLTWCPSKKYHYFMRSSSIMHQKPQQIEADFEKANDALRAFIVKEYPKLLPRLESCFVEERDRRLKK